MALSAWRNTAGIADGFVSVDRALHTATTIAEKPTTIYVVRDGSKSETGQVVRIDPQGSPSTQESDQIRGTGVLMMILGYKDHPTITDTDLRHSDRFVLNGQWYEVIQVFPEVTGRLEALAEAKEDAV